MNIKKNTIIGALVLIAVFVGIKMYASNAAEAKVNEAIAKVTDSADIDYESVSVDLLGMDTRISDITVSPVNSKEKIKIDEIIIYDMDDSSDIPAFLSMSVRGIELDIKELGKDAKKFIELGYNDKIMINLNADYTYDKEKRELDIKKIGVGADDVGEISINFRIGNIGLTPEEITGLLLTFPQILFHEAEIKYEDDSLVGRLMKQEAKEQKLTDKDFKKSIVAEIEKEIENVKDEFSQKAMREMIDFVEDPEEFSISIKPKKAYPFGRIMRVSDPIEAIKLLNIEIKS